ncbi:acyl carrier protein [Labrys sp. KNU-23]|uniref:acyl carrier protein n=1 Tax=Labrys sp. KNU-23 TaxID=2789216 RepID=UPI0011EF3FB2|nr:acyl carrier protein [Labrys sp. KNU-23]QEN85053.1 acyl carrier protein [Labrys sp. KNU-23]
MNRKDILEKIASCLADVLDEDSVTLDEKTTADDVEGWDSISHVKLIIALETALGIRFESNEITAPENVGQMVDLVESKLARA